MAEMCDECAKELIDNPYVRVQVWGDGLNRFERVFCSPECAKSYMKEWTKEIFYDYEHHNYDEISLE